MYCLLQTYHLQKLSGTNLLYRYLIDQTRKKIRIYHLDLWEMQIIKTDTILHRYIL